MLRSDVDSAAVDPVTVVRVSVRTRVPTRAGNMARRASTALVAAVVGLLLLPAAAAAQTGSNSLQDIDPAEGEILTVSPTVITLSFNQELGPDDQPTLGLSCGGGQPQPVSRVPEINSDRLVVTFEVQQPLPRGACIISWALNDALGNPIVQDQSTFRVEADPPATTGAPGGETGTSTESTADPGFDQIPAVSNEPATESSGADGSTGGAVWLGRVLSTIGILVLFGGLALISLGWPEGPEYVVTVRYLRAVWLIGLVGTVLFLIAYSAEFNDISLGSALNPSTWLDLKDDGWGGRGALLRLVFVIGAGWVAMRPERIIDPTSAMWAWALPGGAVIAASLSGVGGPAAIIGFLVGTVHLFGAAIWVGGAALVARVVLAGPGEEDLVQATRAFSRITVPAILVTVVTGIAEMVRLDGGQLFSSSHGQVLLLKVVAVAAMLAVALAARQQVAMRLDRAHEMTAPLADRFRRAFGAETALGVVVLAFSGWMVGLTPPKVDPLASQTYTREIPLVDQATGLDATVFVGPARVGRNGLKIEVEAPQEGITNLELEFVPPPGTLAHGVKQGIPLTTAGTAWLPQSSGLPFEAEGTWEVRIFASTANGVVEGLANTFRVDPADGSSTTETDPPDGSTSLPPVQISIVDQSTTTPPFAPNPEDQQPPEPTGDSTSESTAESTAGNAPEGG